MPKLICTVGLPGCGKTTWAKLYVKRNTNAVIICRDDLRDHIYGGDYHFSKAKEQFITDCQIKLAEAAVESNKDIIIADTNLNSSVLNRWKTFSKNNKYNFEIKDFFKEFETDEHHRFFSINAYVKRCKQWNLQRTKIVPEKVIDDMAKKYYYSTIQPVQSSIVYNKMDAIIVDIDGTIAHKGSRNPYDMSSVLNDTPDSTVITDITDICLNTGTKIIIVSGRSDICRDDTEQWLNNHHVPYDELYMRKDGDNRPDEIVKFEIFKKYIHETYNVLKVYDDRDKVVHMWRNLCGLKVYQVAEGNF